MSPWHLRRQICSCAVADLGGAPYGQKFSQFHAVFRKIWQNHMLAPLGGLAPPPMGNPGSAPGVCNLWFKSAAVNSVYSIGIGPGHILLCMSCFIDWWLVEFQRTRWNQTWWTCVGSNGINMIPDYSVNSSVRIVRQWDSKDVRAPGVTDSYDNNHGASDNESVRKSEHQVWLIVMTIITRLQTMSQ